MKKLFLMLAIGWMAAGLVMAGGIVTNTNQSASWVRMPAQDATRNIDAVFYNPAGLFRLKDGFHLSINNQYISQQQKVENFYKGPGDAYGLNQSLYKGTVTAPLFPGIYGVYKMDKLAISFGINPIGGGGGAEYKTGLPSFEMSPSDLVPSLASQGATGYKLDTYFKGTSVYMGYQLGLSYKISDMVQVFVGARYVTVKNTYSGYLKNIQLNMGGNWMSANTVLQGVAAQLTGITTIPTELAPAIAGGFGGATLAQLVGAGAMTAADEAQINAALAALQVPAANIPLMTVNQISGTVTAATPTLNAQAAAATANAGLVSDQEADVTQTGSGITPIIGVNLSLTEKLNIGIKYEFATKMDVTNKTTKDVTVGFTSTGTPITMFPDGAKTNSDMPAYLSVGAEYAATDKLTIALGAHYYFDRAVNYGKSIAGVEVDNKAVIDHNFIELAAGLEYKLSGKFLVSAGYLMTKTGVNDAYQTDLDYSLSTNTFGLGGQYAFTENIKLNFGYANTFYTKGQTTIDHLFTATNTVIPANQTYWKNTQIISLGIDLSF
jgi:long-chain fatty acid transport protein